MCFSIALLIISNVFSCTNLIVTKGANVEGYNTFGYNADGFRLFGGIAARPATDYPDGSYTEIYEMDSGHYLGQIPQVKHTYNVVGLMNEFGLAVAETTFGGVYLGDQEGALIDYESLLYLTLQRARNASEAITVIDDLLQRYGYYSDGESFTIGDKNEIWIMEIQTKGKYEKGAVWVARRIPDGAISGHANQARITTFPWDDEENTRHSADVLTFAQKVGLYPTNGTKEDFDFAAVYDPISFSGARFCDARVWSFFSYALGASTMANFTDYVLGKNLTVRMPLYYHLGDHAKISLKDLRNYMGNHYEGLALDPTLDVGAGPFHQPHRWTPNTWTVNNVGYVNERVVGTQQTFFSYIHQIRDNVHSVLGGITWIGFDDSSTGCPVPQYSTISSVHTALTNDSGAPLSFSFSSFFWIFNLVANWANTRYDAIYPEIKAKRDGFLLYFDEEIATADAQATLLANEGLEREAKAYLTQVSYQWSQKLLDGWLDLFKYLYAKYHDGTVQTNTSISSPGYGEAWLRRIVDETGTRYLEPTTATPSTTSTPSTTQPSASFQKASPRSDVVPESVRSFLALFDETETDAKGGTGAATGGKQEGDTDTDTLGIGADGLLEPYTKADRLKRLSGLKGI